MSLEEVKAVIHETLLESGIMIDSIGDDLDLRDFIQDSVQFISFAVNLEQKLDVELNDELLLFDSIASFNNYSQKIYDLLNC